MFLICFIKVVEPRLLIQVTPSQTSAVNPDSEVLFTAHLRHAGQSSTHAYRVLLEVAVPHEYMKNVQQIVSPGVGSLSIVSGNQAPSRNPRYDDLSFKALVVTCVMSSDYKDSVKSKV